MLNAHDRLGLDGTLKLEPGQFCVYLNARKWVIARILTIWRNCKKSYPTLRPMKLTEVAAIRVQVCEHKPNLGGAFGER